MGINSAIAIVRGLIENGNFGADGKNQQLHDYFVAGLKKVADKHPGTIAGPHGSGGMVALTPLDGSAEAAAALAKRLFAAGLMSFMAGGNPSRLRFLMPLGCTETSHIDLACEDHRHRDWRNEAGCRSRQTLQRVTVVVASSRNRLYVRKSLLRSKIFAVINASRTMRSRRRPRFAF